MTRIISSWLLFFYICLKKNSLFISSRTLPITNRTLRFFLNYSVCVNGLTSLTASQLDSALILIVGNSANCGQIDVKLSEITLPRPIRMKLRVNF